MQAGYSGGRDSFYVLVMVPEKPYRRVDLKVSFTEYSESSHFSRKNNAVLNVREF